MVALGVIALGLYVSLGRQLVPMLEQYRAEVQQRAENLLQMPVRIGRLEGQWQRFSPRLLVHDLTLGEGNAAVQLERVVAVVDVFETLRSRQLSLHALELEAPRLIIEEYAEGQWRIDGLPHREGEAALDPRTVLDGLQRLRRITVLNGQLTLQAFAEEPRTLSYLDLQLDNRQQQMHLDARALLPDGLPLTLSAQGQVDPARWQDASLEAFLHLPASEWSAWLPRRLTADWRLEQLRGGAQAWLSWNRRSLERAAVQLEVPHLAIGLEGRDSLALSNLGLKLHARRQADGYDWLLQDAGFEQGESRWREELLAVRQRADATGAAAWQVLAPRLDIAPLVPLVEALAPLPELAREILADLQPHGLLRNLTLDIRPAAEPAERLAFAANVEAVGFAARQWIPAADNIRGSVQGTLLGGELRLDADDASLHLTQLFPAPWRFPHAAGRLRWSLEDEAVTLSAPHVELAGEEGRFTGDFLIRLHRDPAREDYMDLRVGLRDGDARFVDRFLPSRLPAMSAALVDWLDQSIRGGTIERGFFTYQGALGAGHPPEARQVSLYAKAREAELAFLPDWPVLQDASGEVWLENGAAQVRLQDGRLFDTRVSRAHARVGADEPGGPVRLQLDGAVEGGLADGLRLVREAPLGIAEWFDGWQVEGPAQAQLELDLHLGADTPPRLLLDVATEGATLVMTAPDIRLERLAGAFRYDSARGLSASDIKAHSFGHPVTGRAVATGAAGRPATRVEASGVMALERLRQWLGVEQALPGQGELPYQLRLTLDGADSQLQVDSSLIGLAIDLPAPFGKDADTRRDSSLVMTLQGEERLYRLQHAQLATVTFAADPADWRRGRGELRLGAGAAALPRQPGLRVRGRLSELDWSAWQSVLQRPAVAGLDQSLEQSTDLLRDVRVQIDRFAGFGSRIEDLSLVLQRRGAAWQADVNSQALAGRLLRPDAPALPLDIHLQHMRLSPAVTPEPGAIAPSDPLQAVDPASLPAMDLRIDQLWRGDDHLGSVGLSLRPVPRGARFGDLDLKLKGLQVGGALTWRDGSSAYRGRIEGDNIGDVLSAWGFARTATSQHFRLDVDGHWPGSPLWFGFTQFSGRLDPLLTQGQFVEVEGGAQALRVFGLLNFDAIGRRLRLDFSDLLGRGLSYDRVSGQLQANQGVYRTQIPLTLKGPSSDLELNGELDLARDRIDAKLLVTLPLTNNLPIAAVLAGAPAIGGAIWIADKLLGDRIARFATVQYDVKGPWQAPEITFDRPFEKPR